MTGLRLGRGAAFLLGGLTWLPIVAAQGFEVDLRPNARVLQRGEGATVTGWVVEGGSGAPVAGAEVSLELNSLPSDRAPKAITDGSGAFTFDGAGPGNYRVTVSKAGFYVRQAQQFITGTPVTIRGGETIEGVELQLIRGGAISGRVVDEFGEPVALVQVQALRYQFYSDGSRQPGFSDGSDFTDDLGRFRLYGLPSGEYGIVARRTTRRVEGPMAPIVVLPALARSGLEVLDVPTYYQGTVNPSQAQTILLPPEGEVSVQLALVNGRMARVSGRVITAAGLPASGLRISLRPTTGVPLIFAGERPLAADGTFSFTGIPPGEYRIGVASANRSIGGERAAISISVVGDDIDDLTVMTAPGGTVMGRVTFDTTLRRGTFQLAARSADPEEGPSGSMVSDPVGPDGAFELRGLPERVYLEPVGGQWAITSVLVNGREMNDEPLDVSGGATLQDVSIVATDRLTVVAGRAHDGRDRPLTEHLVILLRMDGAGPPPLRSRRLWTGTDGTFQLRGLRPGTYVAAVVEDLEPGYEHSPEFLEAIRARGHRFTLTADTPADLSLTLLPLR
jgi:protocatechuate 3,4-dioxygenase beta subunit